MFKIELYKQERDKLMNIKISIRDLMSIKMKTK